MDSRVLFSIGRDDRHSVVVLHLYLFTYLAAPGCAVAHGMGSLIFAVACRILGCGMWDLVPRPGIEPGPSALGVWSPSH